MWIWETNMASVHYIMLCFLGYGVPHSDTANDLLLCSLSYKTVHMGNIRKAGGYPRDLSLSSLSISHYRRDHQIPLPATHNWLLQKSLNLHLKYIIVVWMTYCNQNLSTDDPESFTQNERNSAVSLWSTSGCKINYWIPNPINVVSSVQCT